MRLIDADKLTYESFSYDNGERHDDYVTTKTIYEAETVDVVPVIRCKDCGYYREKYRYCIGRPTEPSVYREPDDFCSKAVFSERRSK